MKIDLNCDLGESYGAWKMGNDEKIIPLITSANIACGFHASDPSVMNITMALAKETGISVGAHPGFPDLNGFGRREMKLSLTELYADMLYQLGALSAFARAHEMKLVHVKPHGAMYNMAAKDQATAGALCQAVYDFDPTLIILAQPCGQLYKAAHDIGLRAAAEVFADRAYNDDGTLAARRTPGSVISDPDLAAKRVIRMIKEQKVTSVTGRDIDIRADSVCVHGDSPSALETIKTLRSALTAEGIEICSLSELF